MILMPHFLNGEKVKQEDITTAGFLGVAPTYAVMQEEGFSLGYSFNEMNAMAADGCMPWLFCEPNETELESEGFYYILTFVGTAIDSDTYGAFFYNPVIDTRVTFTSSSADGVLIIGDPDEEVEEPVDDSGGK